MKSLDKNQKIFVAGVFSGTILLAIFLTSIDFLYAGIQEYFITNINPSYIPETQIANSVIIGSSIAFVLSIVLFIVVVWLMMRSEQLHRKLEEEEVFDKDGSMNFNTFQKEISGSISILRNLFAYLVIVVATSALFSFLRFIWMLGKFRTFDQYFIKFFLSDAVSLGISISLYFLLAALISYIIITSMQRYKRLQIISINYEKAMTRVKATYDMLLQEKEDEKKDTKKVQS
ncbi:MAG: hypothetical protein ACTSO7_11650 [Candidatus Heimdallarchaeota archaeon]